MNLSHAQKIAVATCTLLQPYCDKIHIAGSIRRKKAEVKDVEIVCLPKTEAITTNDLFGSGEPKYDIITGFTTTVLSLGEVVKGNTRGRYMQIKMPEITLDLFMPLADDFYRQYAIRTGSAEYAQKVIATGWKKIGWCGSDIGLRRIEDCSEHKQPDGKIKYKCERNKNNLPPIWVSEEQFFQWINVPFIAPELRF